MAWHAGIGIISKTKEASRRVCGASMMEANHDVLHPFIDAD